MSEQKIVVIYRADGSVERHPVNLPGASCHAATREYQALDARHGAVADTPTADALLPTPAATQIDLKG